MSHDPLDEVVAWIPCSVFRESDQASHGYSTATAGFLDRAIEAAQWSARRELEEDPTRKQVIPYVLILGDRGVWTMRRKSAQTEARLHGKGSFGVGGHVEETGEGFLERGMRRELHEEVSIEGDSDFPLQFTGTINDDTNPVGAVHLGFVFVAYVGAREVAIREVDKMEGGWTRVDELEQIESPLETWSELLLGHIPDWAR
jgi:predicted NUDIX family phosphoesterase